MKQIVDDIMRTTYKELKVTVMDKDEWKSSNHSNDREGEKYQCPAHSTVNLLSR